MWELGWRARLRRIDFHPSELGAMLPNKLLAALSKPLGSTFDDVLDANAGVVSQAFQPDTWQNASDEARTLASAGLHWELVH
jgi:hypothetical protein